MTALAVTGGGLALRAGLLLLSRVVGSFQLSAIFTARETIAAHGLHLPIVVLVLLIPSWQDLRDLRASERSRTFEETARRQHDR